MAVEPTGSDYICDALAAEGVSTVFGLIGEGNAHLLDRMGEASPPFVQARHEQAAVSMADGYARATGSVGLCTVTHGPGVTNAVTGLACADRDGVGLVVLVGDTAIEGRETSLQYLDHLTVTSPVSGYGTRVESVDALPEVLSRAFDRARTRSAPAVVEIPQDVQEGTAPDEPYRPGERKESRTRPDLDRLTEAVDILDGADRPAILAGGGAMRADAGEGLARLAERLGAPIATTYFGKGILPDSHPLVSGIGGTFMSPASDALLPDADALLAVGTQLSGKITRYGELYADAAIVQVDVDPDAIGRHEPVDIGLLGDARATVDALTQRVTPRPDRAESVVERIRDAPEPWADGFESHPDLIDPRELTLALSERTPDDALVAVDSGNNTGFPAVFHEVGEGGRMLVNGNFGSMGYALPAALGASVADPDRPVVCYIGDGALLQVIQEIETGARIELPVVVALFNDSSYGIIRHRQNREFGRETASTYDSPAFADIAEGFGARAVTVRSVEDLDAVDDYLAGDPSTPLVLDARTIPEVTRPGFPPY
jgi:thiamine pyrophosphate-dependent acetolactate synthase large subunit-like protein